KQDLRLTKPGSAAPGVARRFQQSAAPPEPSRWPTFAAGLVLGTLLGAAIGLTFAPRSGRQTRRRLARRARRLRRQGRDAWDDLRDELRRYSTSRRSLAASSL